MVLFSITLFQLVFKYPLQKGLKLKKMVVYLIKLLACSFLLF